MTASLFSAGGGPYAGYLLSFIILILAAIIVVALRLFVKWRFARNVGPEDWFSVVALGCAIVMTALMSRESYYVLAYSGNQSDGLTKGLKSMYANMIFYQLSLFFTKISFLLQYLRIFPTKKMRTAIWTVFGIVIIYGGWTVFSMVFFCTPIEAYWKLSNSDRCFDAFVLWLANGVLNIFTDLLIIALPLPGLKALMLPRGQKLGLMFVFALGGVVCVASMLRVFAIIFAPPGRFPHWGEQPLVIWTAIETNIAIICSCLPTLRTLAIRLWKKIHVGKRIRSSFGSRPSKVKISSGSSSGSSEEECKKETSITVTTEVDSSSVDKDDLEDVHDQKRPGTVTYSISRLSQGSDQV